MLLKIFNRPTLLAGTKRYKHRNHPGHKPKPLTNPTKRELPDRYLNEATYPPVKPKYPPGNWPADYNPKLAWLYWEEGQKYTSLRTIQERLTVLAYMNVQQTLDDLKQRRTRFYPIFQLSSLPKSPKMLPFVQFITKTNVNTVKSIPSYDDKLNTSIDSDLYAKLMHCTKETILKSLNQLDEDRARVPEHPDTYKPAVLEREKQHEKMFTTSNRLIKDIFTTLTTILATSDDNVHLLNAQHGSDVSIQSYWKRCGFGEEKPRGAVHPDPDVIRFQFNDVASYQIKCDKPLNPIFDLADKECVESPVPEYVYCPTNFKIFSDHTLPMQVPGHWYGETREFNYLTVFNTTKTFNYYKSKYPNYEDHLETLKSMAVLSAHAELTAQSYYLGFSMWKDLIYPLMGQFLFTDGQDYSLCNYQLNTVRLWNKGTDLNNLCYLTVPERLFEINGEKTQITKFNENLFRRLLNMLAKRPVTDETELVKNYSELDHMIGGSRLRPYLAVSDFKAQLTKRHQLLATNMYELVKYDRPMSYLLYRDMSIPVGEKPKFPNAYSKYTYDYRDIVIDYYPRDFYGIKLIERLLRKAPKQSERFWDLKTPVFEWTNVPPPDINNIPREIKLPLF